jgi:hypothetical protein
MSKKYDQSGRTCEKVGLDTARRMNGRWSQEILEWYLRGCERKQGVPS